jgi:hypothetical protein
MSDVAAGAPAANTAAPVEEAPRSDARFYLVMAGIAALLILAGFTPSFYLKPLIKAPPPLSALTVVHGVVFTGWMALFLAQATFIATNRVKLHRQLGIAGAVLFGAMLSLGFSTAITAGRLGHIPPGAPEPLAFMALPVVSFALTGGLVVAALWLRRRSDWHKRLMLAGLFTMTGPGTGRIAIPLGFAQQGVWIAVVVAELLLLAAIAYDQWRYKRVHPAYLIAAALSAGLHLFLAWAFASPPAWMAFARWLTAVH